MKIAAPIQIRLLQEEDIGSIAESFLMLGWNKPASQYRQYLQEQQQGQRVVLVALSEGRFAGYLTIVWESDYPSFRAGAIPELQDLNVLPQVRRKGIATQLMEEAEQIAAKRSSEIGIGVGLSAEYGAAQRLYVLRGYVPDGKGLVWENRHLKYGEQARVDDGLVLMFVKRLAV